VCAFVKKDSGACCLPSWRSVIAAAYGYDPTVDSTSFPPKAAIARTD
jgi:hypothetical protein